MTDKISKLTIDITIAYIEKVGWQNFHPFELVIHRLIDLPLPFSSKQEFLIKTLDVWHHDILSSLPLFDKQITLHERFFEVFMTRFEILNPYKNFLQHVIGTPKLIPSHIQNYAMPWWRSISDLYDIASGGHDNTNLARYKQIFIWFYLKTLPTWFKDQNPDLAVTMSAWDTNIHKFLTLASRLP